MADNREMSFGSTMVIAVLLGAAVLYVVLTYA
jgi:hypothetical protein